MKGIKSAFLATSVLCGVGSLTSEAEAQESSPQPAAGNADIIVTARRIEERLSDVPISISVLSQEDLQQNNLSNMSDLATITPGLQLNNRYGNDFVSFTIRGFTQEIRTYSTVGIYFADVVGPRGSGSTLGGDGVGPGSLFDLENVQVLKGPQGTLFGRNTSGGAVLLVPKKPTDKFEGYVEGTIGEDDLLRGQAVVNVPVSDNVKLRFGVDRMVRDGYLHNVGPIQDGAYPGKGMGNTDYIALRASMLIDVTPDIENYTIATYTDSKSNGVTHKLFDCVPGVLLAGAAVGDFACAQIEREAQFGRWAVTNRVPDAKSDSEQWQIINTTTWDVSENLTVKNIIAYGEYRSTLNQDVFGITWIRPTQDPSTITSAADLSGYAVTHAEPYSNLSNAESSFVEELQFQGTGAGERLTWQAGGYMEMSDPLGPTGQQSYSFTACENPSQLDCTLDFGPPRFSLGSAGFQTTQTKFRNYAVYGQASFELTDQLTVTGGLRYTWDKQSALIQNETISLAGGTTRCRNRRAEDFGQSFPIDQRRDVCFQNLSQKTSAPTWMIDVEYRPVDDIMVYAKYSRGYRQGGLAIFSPDPLQAFEDEKIDSYEVGFKSSWRGAVPGSFEIFGYYNDFTNQQLLLSISDMLPNPDGTSEIPTIAIVNAGASEMYGFETELTLRPFEGMSLRASYAYVKTELKEFTAPTLPAESRWDTVIPPAVGGPITSVVPHQLTLSANYTLPLPPSAGSVSLGALFSYSSSYQSTNDSQVPGMGDGRLPSAHSLNLNLTWEDVASYPIDLGLFVTNVTNEANYTFVTANLRNGFNSGLVAPPRRWGLRVRYKFGQ